MSTRDGGLAKMGIEGQAPAFSCGAGDLKVILGAIADHIADADKRHSEALGAMQQRLAELGSQAKGMRAELPAEMQPALDRIEAGMAELSDKLADPEAPSHEHADHHAAAPYTPPSLSEPPAALRSVAAGDHLASFTRRDESARAAVKPAVDTFDVVSFDESAAEEEPWDAASAEALTKLYESHALEMLGQGSEMSPEEAPVSHTVSHEQMTAPPALHIEPAVHIDLVQPHVATHAAFNVEPAKTDEHVWLEQRFAEIALKLDSSLSAFNPDAGFGDLSSKFTRLEEQLVSVLAETPSKADLTSLKAIETQVEDLTLQLDTVQSHFARLDSIEAELRTLSDRISEENLGRMLERATPRGDEDQIPRLETALKQIADRLSEDRLAKLAAAPAPAALDTDAMARQVAAVLAPQLSSRVSSSAPPADDERIDELHHLLTGFINERRHGEEQTTTMLDTMQQAMIRLLDRMDALETGGSSNMAALEAELNRPEPFTGAPEDEPLPHARRRSDAQRESIEPATPPQLPPQEHAAPELRAVPPVAEKDPASAPSSQPASRPELIVDQDKPAELSPGPMSRDDFVASARRAARQAAQAPRDRDTEETQDQEAVLAMDPVKAPPKRAAARAAGGRRSPSMLTIGLACLIVAGASFMVAKPYLVPTHAPAGAAQPASDAQQPAAAPKAPKPLDLDDGEEIIDKSPARNSGDRGPAMTPPKRSSTTGPTSIGDSGPFDPSNGSIAVGSLVDGNGNIVAQRDLGIGGMGGSSRQQDARMPVQPVALAPLSSASDDATARANPELPPATIGPNSLRQAAMKGDPSAEFEIGARFAEGKGVAQDLKQAVSWYQRAASKGFAPAQYRYASMLERGLGAKADLAKASVWYQRAAEQGIVKAMHNLAVLTSGRDGVPADHTLAMRWFTSAAEYGLVDSQFNLAIMHENGLGVEKDNREAYKWFSLAARAGDAEASKRRDVVKTKLSPSELREIDAQIESWRSKMADNAINDPRQAGEAWKQRAR